MNRKTALATAAGVLSMGAGIRKQMVANEKKALEAKARAIVRQVPRKKVSGRKPSAGVSMNGPPVISALPRLRPKIEMKPGPQHNTVRVSVVDYLGPLVVPDETPNRGMILFSQTFSPARIPGSKLSTISTMYERYVVNRLRFHYSAACPTTVGGALIMAFDKDPGDVNFAGEPGIRHAIGLSSMTQFAPWEHASMAVEKDNEQTFYFTSPALGSGTDSRLENMGSLFIIASTPGSIVAEQSLGDIWVEAEVTYYDPTWEPTDVTATVEQPTDSGHTMSLVTDEGFSGMQSDSVVSESNVAFINDGTLVGLSADAVGFLVAGNNTSFHLVDNFVGCATTVRITGETLTLYPVVGENQITPDGFANSLSVTATYTASATSATQTNWVANFSFTLPQGYSDEHGDHFVGEWYVVANLIGTVGGTYTGRTVAIHRESSFGRNFPAKKSRRRVLPPKTLRRLVPSVRSDPQGKDEIEERPTATERPVTPGKPQWVKIQVSSE